MAWPPPELMADPRLTNAAKLFAVALWWPVGAQDRDPKNWQSVAALARRAGMSRTTAFRARRALLDCGWATEAQESHPATKVLMRIVRLKFCTAGGTPPYRGRDVPRAGPDRPTGGTEESHGRDPTVPRAAHAKGEGSLREERGSSSPERRPQTGLLFGTGADDGEATERDRDAEATGGGAGPHPDGVPDADEDPGEGDRRSADVQAVAGGVRRRKGRDPSAEAVAAARHLYEAIRWHSPGFLADARPAAIERRLLGWARDIDVGMRNDGMTLDGCKQVIDVAHRSDDEFWRPNLLSGKKLRQHYEKLRIRASTRGMTSNSGAFTPRGEYTTL